ncbi:MAG: hypothetical protein WDW38_001546 [Sanguina aurantia]
MPLCAQTIDIPIGSLSSFKVHGTQIQHSYKHKNLKAAFCSLPQPKDCGTSSTKVSIDSNGLLKVSHMISMPGHAPNNPRAEALVGNNLSPSQARGTAGAAKMAIVQFASVPCLDGDGER